MEEINAFLEKGAGFPRTRGLGRGSAAGSVTRRRLSGNAHESLVRRHRRETSSPPVCLKRAPGTTVRMKTSVVPVGPAFRACHGSVQEALRHARAYAEAGLAPRRGSRAGGRRGSRARTWCPGEIPAPCLCVTCTHASGRRHSGSSSGIKRACGHFHLS